MLQALQGQTPKFRPRGLREGWLKFNQGESLATSHAGSHCIYWDPLLLPLCISVPIGYSSCWLWQLFLLHPLVSAARLQSTNVSQRWWFWTLEGSNVEESNIFRRDLKQCCFISCKGFNKTTSLLPRFYLLFSPEDLDTCPWGQNLQLIQVTKRFYPESLFPSNSAVSLWGPAWEYSIFSGASPVTLLSRLLAGCPPVSLHMLRHIEIPAYVQIRSP